MKCLFERQISTFVIIIIFLSFSATKLSGQVMIADSWKAAQQKRNGFLIVTYIKTPGLSFKDNYGNLDGVCFDIVKEFIRYVKRTRGVQLQAKVMPETQDFNKFMTNIKNSRGGVFGLGNITITPERERLYDFSPPFINNLSFMITHNSVRTLSSVRYIASQFKGMKAYTVKGTTNEKIILQLKQKYYPSLPIVYVPNSGAVMDKIIRDQHAFTSLDFNYYAEALKRNQPVKRHSVGDNVSEKFGIIMPNNSDWKPLWDEFILEYRFTKSLEYRQILVKHLGISAVKALERYAD